MEFEPGITAVVGPNGSGKSNIADSIRWVLGEQSKQLLRGKKAEDVIFAGSASRAKSGTAFVSVVFDNHDGKFPIDSAEVVFSRRIQSDGTSEYLINNQPSRLLDITEALIAAGFGKLSYTVIGQGTIDQFLLQGPSEIKNLIEEGAGIAPLYHKRNKTINRLQLTHENLTQVSALIAEIEPRLRNLRRQAKKLEARAQIESQWRELFSGRLKHILSHLGGQKNSLDSQIADLQLKIDSLEGKVQDYFKSGKGLAAGGGKVTAELTQLQREINKEQSNKEKLQLSLAEIKARGAVTDTAEIRKFELDLKELKVQIRDIEQNLSDTEKDIAQIIEILNTAKPDLVPRFNFIADKFVNSQKQFLTKMVESGAELEIAIAKHKPSNRGGAIDAEDILTEIRTAEEKINSLQNQLNEKLAGMSDLMQKRESAEKVIREEERNLNNLRAKQNELKVERAKIEAHLEEEEKRARQELGLNFKGLVDKAQSVEDATVDEQVIRLKKQLEMIGGLDEMTLQEYQETEERYSYLTTQVKDLEKAAADLAIVLQELETVIKDRFHKAFTLINDKFGEYFRLLFNGGRASLHKILGESSSLSLRGDEDDEAITGSPRPDTESGLAMTKKNKEEVIGIEVKATPAGKKLSSIAALSGGERSLTSIALLMALLDAYPSPFVVLDEVDAALDESNSIRFATILGNLSHRTQFVNITHNRETMRRSNTLYGVTMNESGVSQVLSLKFDQSIAYANE